MIRVRFNFFLAVKILILFLFIVERGLVELYDNATIMQKEDINNVGETFTDDDKINNQENRAYKITESGGNFYNQYHYFSQFHTLQSIDGKIDDVSLKENEINNDVSTQTPIKSDKTLFVFKNIKDSINEEHIRIINEHQTNQENNKLNEETNDENITSPHETSKINANDTVRSTSFDCIKKLNPTKSYKIEIKDYAELTGDLSEEEQKVICHNIELFLKEMEERIQYDLSDVGTVTISIKHMYDQMKKLNESERSE